MFSLKSMTKLEDLTVVFLLSLQADGKGGGWSRFQRRDSVMQGTSHKKYCKVFKIDSLRDVSIVNCALEGYGEQLGKVCICQIAFFCGQILSFML